MLTLPLAKLSTAEDGGSEGGKFSWKHDAHNLVVVIDTYGASGPPSQLLKVVQGTQVRHYIELENLINETNDVIARMHEHGVQLRDDQLPISALVRCPLLAIRWQLPDKTIRRAQLRFKNGSDYDTAYNHLHQLGLRMSAAPESQSRSPSSVSAKSSSSPANSSNSSHARKAPTTGSYPPARLTEMSNRPYTATNAPTSIESQVQEAARARPSSAYTGYSNTTRDRMSSFSGPLRPPEYFARPDSATSQILDLPSATQAYAQHDRPFETVEHPPSSLSDRPESAMLYNHPDTSESNLPPRRELPFARTSTPRSAGSDTNRPGSRPSSVMMGPPPLPARVSSLRPPSNRAANPEVELPPLPKPTIISTAQQQPSWMQQPPRTPNQDQVTPPSAQPMIYEDQENRPMTSSSQSSSPLSYKRSSTSMLPSPRPLTDLGSATQNRRHTESQPLSDLGSAAQNRRRTESQSPHSTPPTSEQFHLPVEKSHAQNPVASDSLAAYAMQSPDGRRAALNEFLFKQLQSDSFITLLEDMEACWARAGMGGRVNAEGRGDR